MQNFPCSFEFHLLTCLGCSSMAMALRMGKDITIMISYYEKSQL